MDVKFLIIVFGFINFLLGFSALTLKKKTVTQISFIIFAWIIAFWCLAMYFYERPIIFPSVVWIKIVYFAVILLFGSLLHFSFVFPSKERKSLILPLSIYFLSAVPFVYVLLFTNLWVRDVVIRPWGVETLLGPAYVYFGIFSGFFSFWLLFNLAKKYPAIKGIGKTQLKYVFLGIILPLIPIVFFDVAVPLIWKTSRYFWLTPFFSVFMVGCFAYAILRYRLMDIRVVLRTGLVYSLTVTILVGGVLGAIYFFSRAAGYTPNVSLVIIGSSVMAMLLFVFIPLKDFLLKITNRYFFNTIFTSQEALQSFAQKASTIIELDKLVKEAVDTIKKSFGLNNAAFLLKEKGVFVLKENIGFKEEHILSLIKEKAILIFLEERRGPLVLEETEKAEKSENLREKMEEMNVSLILPLFRRAKLTGLVVLGPKAANEAYSKEDLELLEILSAQIPIALENAGLYAQIQDLSLNLQKKVDEQTGEIKKTYGKMEKAYEAEKRGRQELKQLSDDLTKANIELKRLDRAKSEFLSIVSHQFRTPLSIIKGYVPMLFDGTCGNLPEPAKKIIANINASNERLINLVNDILNISRIETGKWKADFKHSSLEALISDVANELRSKAEEKGVKLDWEEPEEPLKKILIDKDMIRQVISNLVDNSIKYTQKGSVAIEVESKNGKILIKIRDSGEGLTKEDIACLFKSFSRGKAGIHFWADGIGLGLYIAKKFIEMHDGKIWAESPGMGKGATFFVELPEVNGAAAK